MSTTTAPRARIDPRIAQRRRSVTFARVQHRRRVVAAMIVTAVVVAGLVALTRSPVVDVDAIEVRGASTAAEAEAVQAAASVALGDPMVDLDATAVAQRVEAIAWVRTADVSRDWPGTVVVAVQPRIAVAAVSRSDRSTAAATSWALVDAEGVIIDEVDGIPSDAPLLLGAAASGPLGAQVGPELSPGLAAAAAFPDSMTAALDHLTVTERGVDLVMGTGGTTTVNVGATTDIAAAYRSLAALFEAGELTCAATVDLEVPGRPLLTRRPDCP
jgi:cell division protein FtsQ